MHTSDLNLLMVHSDDHDAVLAGGLPEASASEQGGDISESATSFWDEGGDPNDLAVQRWGVIAPLGPEGDRLLALVQPLLALAQFDHLSGESLVRHLVPALARGPLLRQLLDERNHIDGRSAREQRFQFLAGLFAVGDRLRGRRLLLLRGTAGAGQE